MPFTAGQRVTAIQLNAGGIQQIATTTLTVATSAMSLNVPATTSYNFIKVSWRVRGDTASAAQQLYLRFNGDTGSNYLWQNVQGNNSTASSNTSGAATTFIHIGTMTCNSATALYFSSGDFEISGASDTTNYKTAVGKDIALASTTNMWAGTYGGQWQSAAAITSVSLTPQVGNFMAGSTMTMYGFN